MVSTAVDPVLALPPGPVQVEPGTELRLVLRIANPTTIVERYALDVKGAAAAWTRIEPDSLTAMPGATAEATIVFAPRRVPAPDAGATPFAIRCRSEVDQTTATVLEGEVVVGGFRELAPEIAPLLSKGTRRGRHRVVLTNRGNMAERVQLVPTDPAEELRFTIPPLAIEVPASGRVEAKLVARAPSRFLKGQPRHHRFEVGWVPVPARTGEPEPAKVAATFVQRPVLSGWMVALLGLVAVLGVLVGYLGATRGSPESTATETPFPELDAVEPISPSSVQLTWTAIPAAAVYRFERSLSDGTGAAPVPQEARTVAGTNVTYVWQDLPPSTLQCFRFAVDGPAPVWSQPVCEQLPSPAAFAPPTELSVEPVPDTLSVKLTWKPSEGAATNVILVDGQPQGGEFPGSSGQIEVAPGEHCFSVLSKAADGALTEPSSQTCLPIADPAATAETTVPTTPTTVAPPGTTTVGQEPPATTAVEGGSASLPVTVPDAGTTVASSPTTATGVTATAPGTTASPTSTAPPTSVVLAQGWYVLLDVIPADDQTSTEPQQRAQERKLEFETAGVPVDLAHSDALDLAGPAWVLYVDGLASQTEAIGLCRTVRSQGLVEPGQNCIPQERRP